MIHLDTGFLIRSLLKDAPEAATLEKWLSSDESLAISSIAWCEFLCGPLDEAASAAALTILNTPVPFTSDDASLAAQLFNITGRRRGSLTDCMISAVAIRAGAMLATTNISDFSRFEAKGLKFAPVV